MPNAAPRTRKTRKPRGNPALTARTADKYVLYQRSVQDTDAEIDFIDRVYRSVRGKRPLSLREDFCGTALLCGSWIKSLKGRTAAGVDIDPEVLAWSKQHNLAPLGEPGERVQLFQQDVRAPSPGRYDVVCAFNFSYWVFRTRDEMRHYFETVRSGVKKNGLFFLDSYGGWESQEPMLEPRLVRGGFTYVWDQDSFNPIDHAIVNYIHFEFKDGSKLNRAFTYEWRYWTLPELTELLLEAGFRKATVHWDTSKDDNSERYRPSTRAENQPGWLAYIAAEP